MNITTVTKLTQVGVFTYDLTAAQQYFEYTGETLWMVFRVENGELVNAGIGGVYETEAEAEAMIAKHAAAIAAKNEGRPIDRGPYTMKNSSVYGEGRIYPDQPGATYYDDGSGRFNVQIWDN